MCLPPKNGGLPCEGELIRSKDCNTNACPEDALAEQIANANAPKIEHPQVVIARFSQRPARFTKCIIKETDIFRLDSDQNKYPSRLVMNNKTLTVFAGDEYTEVIDSWDLQKSDISPGDRYCCFNLMDPNRNKTFCGFDSVCGDPETNEFVTDFINLFSEFKTTCNVGRQTHLLKIKDQEALNKKKGQRVATSVQHNEEKQLQKSKADYQIVVNTNQDLKMKDTQSLGEKAMEKELMIENLIKEDEQKKENEKLVDLNSQIKEQKKKAKNINNQIQKRVRRRIQSRRISSRKGYQASKS